MGSQRGQINESASQRSDRYRFDYHLLYDEAGQTFGARPGACRDPTQNGARRPISMPGVPVHDDGGTIRGPAGYDHASESASEVGFKRQSGYQPNPSDLMRHNHLTDLVSKAVFVEHSNVNILLGQDNLARPGGQEIRHGAAGDPIAMRTSLGWSFGGAWPSAPAQAMATSVNFIDTKSREAREAELGSAVKRFWHMEGESVYSDQRGQCRG